MSKVVEAVKPDVVVTKRANGTLRVDHMNYEKSMTQQCFSPQCDVNRIMHRWLSGGPPPVSADARATFRDVSHGMDYQELLNVTMAVKESFDSLPADLRAQFKNEPSVLLDFVANPANEDECIRLGLIDSDSGTRVPDEVQEQLPLDVTVRTDTTSVS